MLKKRKKGAHSKKHLYPHNSKTKKQPFDHRSRLNTYMTAVNKSNLAVSGNMDKGFGCMD